MLPPFRAYLDALRQFPFSVLEQPQHYFRRPGHDFTRRRSLYLERGELKDYLKDYYRQILQTLAMCVSERYLVYGVANDLSLSFLMSFYL